MRGVEALFTNCTGPCGVVQLLRAPRSTTVEVLSSTHALPAIGAGGAGTYVVGASRRSCARADADPFISIQFPNDTGDDLRAPPVTTRAAVRRTRSIRIYQTAADGTRTQLACAASFVL